MDLNVTLQNDVDRSSIVSLDEFLLASPFRHKIQKAYSETSPDGLGMGGGIIEAFVVSIAATATFEFLKLLVNWGKSSGAAQTRIVVLVKNNSGDEITYVIDTNKLPSQSSLMEFSNSLIQDFETND